jgi:hypothetical protein
VEPVAVFCQAEDLPDSKKRYGSPSVVGVVKSTATDRAQLAQAGCGAPVGQEDGTRGSRPGYVKWDKGA